MKVPAPRRLKNGKWYIYMRLGGQAYPVTDANKADCVARARSIKAQYKAGELDTQPTTRAAPATLGAVIDAYIDKYAPVLSPATVRGYKIMRKHQFQAFMGTPVNKIDYQNMVNTEARRVGPKTIQHAWGLVRAALRDAEAPVPNVRLPAVPPKEIAYLQPEEIKPFLEAIKGHQVELAALLMLHGLRVSEALAMRWPDSVDLKGGRLIVSGAMVRNEDNGYSLKAANKNRTSSRSVPIMIPRLRDLLAASRRSTGPVITQKPRTTLYHIQEACRRAGVTVVGNHGLRHSFASLCRFLAIPEEQTMAWGGWADYQTMHKRYIHMAQTAAERDAKKMADFFQNANQNAN